MSGKNVTCFTTLLWAAACLPEGGPGIGERIVSERGLGDLLFTETRAPGWSGLLYSHRRLDLDPPPGRSAQGCNWCQGPDLFLLTGGAAPSRLIEGYEGPPRWDAAGRLYLQSKILPPGAHYGATAELWRFLPGQSAGERLRTVHQLRISEGGTRLLIRQTDVQWVLRDLDDREMALPRLAISDSPEFVGPRVVDPTFVGEDLFFLHDGALLQASDPTVSPSTVVAGGVVEFVGVGQGGDRTVLLVRSELEQQVVVLRRGSSAPPQVWALRKREGRPVLAPDGRRLAWVERLSEDRGQFRVIDLESESETTADLPLPPPERLRPGEVPPGGTGSPSSRESLWSETYGVTPKLEFRPGSDELWCFLEGQRSILGADGQVRTYPRRGLQRFGSIELGFVPLESFNSDYSRSSESEDGERSTRFSSDGRFWFFVDGNETGLGDANSPESDASAFVFARDDLVREVYEVVPGRLVAFFAFHGNSRDFFLLDLDQRTSRRLARGVDRVQFGPTRAVLLVRALGGGSGERPSDLALVDLASSAETLLARNVTTFALAPACPDCEPTEAGAQLRYVVHSRVAWKYDGLWSGLLP